MFRDGKQWKMPATMPHVSGWQSRSFRVMPFCEESSEIRYENFNHTPPVITNVRRSNNFQYFEMKFMLLPATRRQFLISFNDDVIDAIGTPNARPISIAFVQNVKSPCRLCSWRLPYNANEHPNWTKHFRIVSPRTTLPCAATIKRLRRKYAYGIQWLVYHTARTIKHFANLWSWMGFVARTRNVGYML